MNGRLEKRYEFGPFRLDTAQHSLLRDGRPVSLTPKVCDLLEVLVRNSGRLVEKGELLEELWSDSFVEEGNLNRNVSILRKALGKDASGRSYIETVPKRGYRFAANVRELPGEEVQKPVTEPQAQRLSAERDAYDAPARSGLEELERAQEGNRLSATPVPRRWLVLGGIVALALGIVIYVLTLRRATDASLPKIQSVAVLPLLNLSGDPAQEYFADGMTEALIGSLAEVRALKVISRTSVMRFKETKKPLPEIAQELNVDAVLEGSVQRQGGRVKIMIQMIHGPTDRQLWAGSYDRELPDVLKLQEEVARAVADEIRIQVTPEERARLGSARSINPEAHEAYMLGRYHSWKYNEEDLKRGVEDFERAIQLDPNYALAYAHLSLAWTARALFGTIGFKQSEAPARAAAQKAFELDDRLPAACVAMGRVKYFYDRDWAGAEEDLLRALELDPNSLDAHFQYANLLQGLGRFPEAIRHIQRARELDPLSSMIEVDFGRILYRARQNDGAVMHLQRGIELEPRNYAAYGRLADVYIQMGKCEDAIASARKAMEVGGDNRYQIHIARAYARMGRQMEARRILEEEKGKKNLSGPLAVNAAAAYAAIGDKDEAFRLLMKTIEERDSLVVIIKEDPPFDALRSDPRWPVLLRRMNFPTK